MLGIDGGHNKGHQQRQSKVAQLCHFSRSSSSALSFRSHTHQSFQTPQTLAPLWGRPRTATCSLAVAEAASAPLPPADGSDAPGRGGQAGGLDRLTAPFARRLPAPFERQL